MNWNSYVVKNIILGGIGTIFGEFPQHSLVK